jgi:hypothetical protein
MAPSGFTFPDPPSTPTSISHLLHSNAPPNSIEAGLTTSYIGELESQIVLLDEALASLQRPREAPLKACPKVKVFQSENSKFPCPKLRFLRPKISQPCPKLRFLSPDSVKISKNDATKQRSVELWQSEHEVENLTLKIGRWKDTK